MPYVLRCPYGGCIYIRNCYIFFLDWSLDHCVVSFLVFCNDLYFKVYFISYEYCYSHFLLIFHLHGISTPHFQSVYPRSEVDLLLLLLFSHSVIFDSLQPCGLHHTRLPCLSLSPGVCSFILLISFRINLLISLQSETLKSLLQ